MKQIKVIVYKIMPVISLDLIDITFEKLVFLKSSNRRVRGREENRKKPFISLH
jgi:hypothetical protein